MSVVAVDEGSSVQAPWLAIEASTQRVSVAVTGGPEHVLEAGATASLLLLPTVQRALAEQGLALAELGGIAVGRGPGAFTGVRTAVSVVQGLAYGTRCARHPQGLPVWPCDSLLAVAEDARERLPASGPFQLWALLDARMGEVYAAAYHRHIDANGHGQWREQVAPCLLKPEGWVQAQSALGAQAGPVHWVGNVWEADPALGQALVAAHSLGAPVAAWPTALALLRLQTAVAQQALAAGQPLPWVQAHQAQPLYVRDQVALTTAERALAAAQQANAA